MHHEPLWREGDSTSRFLLSVASGEELDPGAADREELLELGKWHGLLGMIADSGVEGLAAAAVYLHLLQKGRQEMMVGHLRRVLTGFHEAGVRAAVLKGPYVAASYAEPRWRTFSDLDLLVPGDEVAGALQVLARDPAVREIPPKRTKADKRDMPLHDDSGAIFNLDLHWDLFSYTQLRRTAQGATAWAWENAEFDSDHALGPLWHLPPGPRICFLCTHALLDHRFRLILIRDLLELAERGSVDWPAVVGFARRFELRSTTYVSLLIARRLLDARIPDGVLKELRIAGPIVKLIEKLLPGTDFVRFDGHSPHPLNLAVAVLHDRMSRQAALAARAPFAAPDWRRRVGWSPGRRKDNALDTSVRSIMILVSSQRRRGAEVFGQRLAEGLQDRGWQVAFTSLTKNTGGSRVEAQSVSHRLSEDLGRLDMDVVRGLRHEIAERRPAILFANGSSTLQYSVAASLGLRPKPLLVYSSIGEPRYWTRSVRQRIGQAVLLRMTDHVVSVSEAGRQQLIRFLGLAESKVSVAHTGVPPEFFDVEGDRGGQELRLLYLGNLSREKDPFSALQAFVAIQESGGPVALRFVGGGPLYDDLRREVEDRDISNVELTGSVDDVTEHLSWADVLVLTSETEGLPGAVLEAAAAGVPAGAFEVGGVGETILDGQTGFLIGDRSPTLLAERLLELDDRALTDMGKEARRFATEHFTLEAAIRRYDEVLSQLAGR